MKKTFVLLVLCIFSVLLCPSVGAVPTEVFFFEDTYIDGLPDGYSGNGFWKQEEQACEIEGTAADLTQMDREFTVKDEVVTLSATFILSGTANMQMRFYDGKTLFQQMHLNPGSSEILVRKTPSGYTPVCPNPSKYRAGIEYSFEIEINIARTTGRMRFTDNSGNWGDWYDIQIINTISKITRWNWIYSGSSMGSKTTIKRMAASHIVDILTDQECVDYVKNTLLLGDLSHISGDMTLPKTGGLDTVISWTSDSPYMTSEGVYTAPPGNSAVEVNLTADISLGEATATRIFTVTLCGPDGAKAMKDRDALFIHSTSMVSENLTLPTTGEHGSVITWESNNMGVIDNDGTVTCQAENETVVLTATVESGTFSVERDFTVTVLGENNRIEESGDKISEYDVYDSSLPSNYIAANCGIVNDAFLLYRYDEQKQVSMQKCFDPAPGHLAFVEMEFAMQGKADKIMQLQLFGSNDTTGELIEIFSAQFRIGKGFLLKGASDSDYETLGDNIMSAGEKNTVRWEMNMYTHTFDTYLNEICVDSGRSFDSDIADVNKILFPTLSDQSPSGIFIYRMESGYRENYREMVRVDADALTIPEQTTEDIQVMTAGDKYGSDISWSSDSDAARYENGTFYITRPLYEEIDAVVTITAELEKSGFTETRTFSLTVLKEKSTEEALDAAENELTEAYVKNMNDSMSDVTTDLNMPEEWVEETQIEWTSSDDKVIDVTGAVERRFITGESKTVTLTAVISKNGETRTKQFTAVVLNPGYDSLITGKTVTASSVDGSYLAGFVVDGNSSSTWRPKSGDENPWVQVDMGSLQWINRASVVTTGGAEYTLKYSANGSHWITLLNKNSTETVFSPVEARYVRLELSGSSPERGITEFGIYKIYNEELCVMLDAMALEFNVSSAVTGNLSLPSSDGEYGSSIIWSSGNTSIIADDGTVTRPDYDTTVTLRATVSKGSKSKVLSYSVTVSGTSGSESGGSESGGGSGGSFVGSQRPSSGDSAIPATPSVSQPVASASSQIFPDLPQGHWAEEAVLYLHSKNILNGYSDGLFYPDREVTRAEFVKMFCAVLELPEGNAVFSDVSDNDWYAKAVRSSAEAGIVKGFSDGAFYPNAPISRQDMAVMIDRAVSFAAISIPTGNKVYFNDTGEIAEYALPSVLRLTEAGLIHGMGDNTFLPLSTATRAQAAQLIYDFLKCGGEIQ